MNGGFNLDRFSQTLVHDAPDAVIYADADGLIQFWNRSAERVFGFTEAEAIGCSLDMIVPEHLRERHWSGFAETLRTGQTRYGTGGRLEATAQRKDGTCISVEFGLLPVRDERGEVAGIGAIVREIRPIPAIDNVRMRLARLTTNMTALHAVRDVRCPFSLAITLVEAFHTANPELRAGPFGWARARYSYDASQVFDVSDRSRRHEAFSFIWHRHDWLPLPEVHGFITVRPLGQLSRLTLVGRYRAPFGIPGRCVDAILSRWLTRRSIQRFADEIASFVEQGECKRRQSLSSGGRQLRRP